MASYSNINVFFCQTLFKKNTILHTFLFYRYIMILEGVFMIEFKDKKIAHRGVFDNKTIPENSLSAFKKAMSLHLAIELDVQLTKDQVVVVFHDENLKRMTGFDKDLIDMTYQEVQEHTLLHTKEKVPTLREVLQLVQEKVLLDIEVKDTKNISRICDLVMKELKELILKKVIKHVDLS